MPAKRRSMAEIDCWTSNKVHDLSLQDKSRGRVCLPGHVLPALVPSPPYLIVLPDVSQRHPGNHDWDRSKWRLVPYLIVPFLKFLFFLEHLAMRSPSSF